MVKFSPLLQLLPFLLAPATLAADDVYTDGAGHPVASPYDYQRAGTRLEGLCCFKTSISLICSAISIARGSPSVWSMQRAAELTAISKSLVISLISLWLLHFPRGWARKVPLSMRFSTVAGESGSPDTNRDPRGFAIKLRTSQGIWDWVFNNTPVFFLRDPTKFPLFIHSQKRDPQTNLRNPTIQWDYWSQNQEAIYQIMILFSNRGTPKSWAQMHGWSGHTYKWVKADGTWHYVQVKVTSQQGIANFNATEAKATAAENPDHNTQDLRRAMDRIEAGSFPTWTVSIQTMTPEQGQKFKYDVNDLTKVWPEDEYPLLEVGKIVLNKNPENWFAEIEQLAFSPSNMVPGAEPSNDPVLQARLFSYPDTARHRLGPNHLEIPINCPVAVHNFQRAGWMRIDGGAGTLPANAANYPSSFSAPVSFVKRPYNLSAIADPVTPGPATTQGTYELSLLDFEQPNTLYNSEFTEEERQSLVSNIIGALNSVTIQDIKQRSLNMFACVDDKLGAAIGAGVGLTAKCALKP
ncbi:catalase [Mycena olivaceomarginata]|nr:catalase [Mycena olivaceomarginata]